MNTTPNARKRAKRAKRSSLALALEPRILLDAAAVETAADVAAQVNATAAAPGVDATPTKSTVTITDTTTSFPPVDLFKDVKVTLAGDNQALTGLVVTVDSSGTNQALRIDGELLALTSGTSGFTEANGISYTVNISGTTTTISLNFSSTDAPMTPADVETLIEELQYQIQDSSVESGSVHVVISRLSDTGDATDLNISATITLDNQINVAPELNSDGSLGARETFSPEELGIGSSNEVAYSADGKYAFVSGTDGIRVFSVDTQGRLTAGQIFTHADLGSINHLVASGDGQSLYTVASNGNLVQLSIEADGTLKHVQTVSVGSGSSGGLAVSDDGKQVYVDASSNYGREVYIYSLDAEGLLQRIQTLEAHRNGAITTAGDYVYVLHSGATSFYKHMMKVYQRSEDGTGTLTLIDEIELSTVGQSLVDYALTTSADGKTLYVGNPSSNGISIYRLGTDNTVSLLGTVSSDNTGSLAMSADGTLLYAATTTGTLNLYAVAADGSLTLRGSVSGSGTGNDIAVSSDGSILVSGGALTRFSGIQTLNQSEPTLFADGLSLRDANFAARNDYQGTVISVSPSSNGGTFGFSSANELTLSNGQILLNGSSVATFVTESDGSLKVTLSASMDEGTANHILQQITYTHASGAIPGSLVNLDVQISDGILSSETLTLQLRINSAPQGNAEGYTPPKATSETEYALTLPNTLFTDADGDKLTWTLSGLPAGLTFNAATRTISGTTTVLGTHTLTLTATDTSGKSASLEVVLEVEQIANREPTVNANAPDNLGLITVDKSYSVTLPADLFIEPDSIYGDTLTWSSGDLPAGLTFNAETHTLSGTPTQLGESTITITATDADGAKVSHTLALRVISQGEADNSAPSLGTPADLLTYSSDGTLSGYSHYVNSISQSSDGRLIVIAGSSGNSVLGTTTGNTTPGNLSQGDSFLTVYSRDPATGELTELQTLVQGDDVDGLSRITSVTFSQDGQFLYIAGYGATGGDKNYAITTFSVQDDGTLERVSSTGNLNTQIVELALSSDGEVLYALSSFELNTYTINADGSLTLKQALGQPLYTNGFNAPARDMAVDANGTIYAISNGRMAIYSYDETSNELTYRGTVQNASAIMYRQYDGTAFTDVNVASVTTFSTTYAVEATGDGYVYVATFNNYTVLAFKYDVDTNSLQLVQRIETLYPNQAAPTSLEISQDGTALYVGYGQNSSTLRIYSIGENGSLTLQQTLATGKTNISRIFADADNRLILGSNLNPASTGLNLVSSASVEVKSSYTEGGTTLPASAVTLSDAEYDALSEGAGNYNGATITLQRDGSANADDSFGFSESTELTRDGNALLLNGSKVADFIDADGKLTITFTADITTAAANAVLQQITYTNASNDPESSITLRLQVQDQYISGTSSLALVLTVTQINDAPQANVTSIENVGQDAGRNAALLFSDANISTVEAGQLISALTFTVSGLRDGASETLRIDGTSIPLVAGSGTTTGGHAWSVTIDADTGVATITLSSTAGMSSASANALVNGLAYANTDKATGTTGVRTVTLTSIKDNGGTDNEGKDTAQFQISNTVEVTVGQSPTLGAEVGSVDVAEEILSDDDYKDLVGVVQSGDLVYVVRNGTVWDSSVIDDVPVSTLYVFQRGEDGSLERTEQISSNAQNGLLGARSLSLSADGSTLYVVTDSGLALFARDSSGALTALGLVASDLSPINDVHIAGNVAYITNDSGITLLHRDADTWTVDGTTLSAPGDTWFTDIQVSADGSLLFVATSGGESLLSVFRIGTDGALTHLDDIDGPESTHYASHLSLSPDGTTLYVVDEERLHILSVATDGTISRVGDALELGNTAKQVLVSPDGSLVVVVTDEQIALYGRAADGTLTLRTQVSALGEPDWSGSPSLSFGDLSAATFSEDGTQLYLTGTFGWDSGMLVLDLKPASVTYVEGADATALLPSTSYNSGLTQGATIVIERSGGALGTDSFTFLDGNSLSLVDGRVMLSGTHIADFVQVDGKLTLTFVADVTQARAQNILRQIAYDNLEGEPAKQMTFSVDVTNGTAIASLSATLNQVVALLPGGTLSDPQLDALNNGNGNYQGSVIVVGREGQANANDVFDFLNSDGLELRNGAIWLNGVSVASVVEAGGSMIVTFTSDISRADAQRVLRSIAYRNTSDDPTADGDKASFTITFRDGTGYSDSQTVELTLVGVNDPAIVDTTALTPTFNAEGERVHLFENTSIDTVEAGQNIWYVIVTLDKVSAGDVLGVGNGRIALDGSSGVRTTETGQQYNLIRNAETGAVTVWLYTTYQPISEVETLVDSLTYGNTGSETSGQRTITLGFVERADENTTTVVADKAVVTLAGAITANTPPTLDDLPTTVPYTEQEDPILIAPDAIIGDAQLDLFNSGAGNYNGTTLTIALGEGKSAADSLGFKAGNGLTLVGNSLQKDGTVIGSVTVADGVMTITFSDAAGSIPGTEDVQNTLRQITYANSSDVPAASVEVSIKLADQRGLESDVQTLAIVITAINDAPVINDDPILSLGDLEKLQELGEIPGLSAPSSSVVSADGSRVYVADSQGNIALFERNTETGELTHVETFPGQTEIVQLQLTADGNALYVLQKNGSSSVIAWYAVDADGKLQQSGSLSGLWDIKGITLAEDGKNLYLINTYTVGVYSRDTTTGALTHLGDLPNGMNSEPYLWSPSEIVSRGDLVFVVTNPSNGSTLIVYQRDANGALTALAHIHSGNTDASGKTISLNNVQHIAVSADGRTIFVANSRTSSYSGWTGETTIENHPQQVDAFSLDPATGELTHLGTISDTPTVEDIALSSDGKALFVTRADGSLAYYSAITLAKLATSQEGLTGADRISVSSDGGVIVVGDSLIVLNAPSVAGPTTDVGGAPVVVFPTLTLNDAELDAANNYRGASVTITGQAGDVFGFLASGDYTLDGNRILRDGTEVATLVQSGTSAVLSFTADVTQSEATALLRQVTYASISGAAGAHDVSLVLNDGEANSQVRTIQVTLQNANQAPVTGNDSYVLDDAKAGQVYNITLPSDLFSDPDGDELTWTLSGLPAGLSFNPTSRTITGTTTAMGEHVIVITASDPRNASVSRELTLVVENSAPVVGVDYQLGGATAGEDYSVALPNTLFSDANDAQLTWTLSGVPEWLDYNATNRTLSGTAPAEAGSYTITITAEDSHGASVSRTLTLLVTVAEVPTTDTVLPEVTPATTTPTATLGAPRFGTFALDTSRFELPGDKALEDQPSVDALPEVRAATPAVPLQNSGSGFDNRTSIARQLADADQIKGDTTGYGSTGSFTLDGSTLRASINLAATSERSISLELPTRLADGSAVRQVTLSNGIALPSGAMSFDPRTGQLNIDREWLKRNGGVRLTLISQDADGNERKTPVVIQVTNDGSASNGREPVAQQSTETVESLPQQLRQETSSALLSEALELLDQLSGLNDESAPQTTRHTA